MSARRVGRGDDEVFGMSFLDVISCAFGAVLAMILISKEKASEVPVVEDVAIIEALVPQQSNPQLLDQLEAQLAALTAQKSSLASRIKAEAMKTADSIIASVEAEVTSEAPVSNAGSMASQFSAGIPVGRRHLIFIVDTSGSMKQQWTLVTSTLEKIINSHPKVTGLQILSDQGDYLMPGYKGRWIPDSNTARQGAMRALNNWSGYSNSSPAEGLEVALKTYAKPGSDVSIYVFGDDFTGSSFEEVRRVVDRWNINRITGKRTADIHAVGFPSGIADRFGTLMRHITNENNGVFIGL